MQTGPILLASSKKRGTDSLASDSPSSKKTLFLGSLVHVDDKLYEIISSIENVCTMRSEDDTEIECSKLDLYPGGKFRRIQKALAPVTFLDSIPIEKNPVKAALMFKSQMLFKSSKGISFIINYNGQGSDIFEFTESNVSINLLSWDAQLHRCLFAAPEVPRDYKGDLIVLAVLYREGIILLGSKRESTFGKGFESTDNSLIFYACHSTEGRAHILFLEVADRIQDVRKFRNHYISSNDFGSFPSCFYFDTDSLSSPKAVALPLTMAKNSESITNSRSCQSNFCLRLLKEMNGAVLASPTVSKKAKRIENSLTRPQVSTKTMFLLTPAERLILLFRLKDGAASS